MIPPPPRSTLFPYTTLFRSLLQSGFRVSKTHQISKHVLRREDELDLAALAARERLAGADPEVVHRLGRIDRKSTRLNSSHSQISYAVFCLKKKNVSDTNSRD